MDSPKVSCLYREEAATGTLTLSGPVGIFEASELREAALGALRDEKTSTVCLDLMQAERLDVSALQVLCALQREVRAAGRLFAVEAPAGLADAWAKIGCAL